MDGPIARKALIDMLRRTKREKEVPEYVVAFQANIDQGLLSKIKVGVVKPSIEIQEFLAKALSDILQEIITPASLFPELHKEEDRNA